MSFTLIVLFLLAILIPKFTNLNSGHPLFSKIPTILSQMYTAQGAFKGDYNRYATIDEFSQIEFSLPAYKQMSFTCENVTDSTFLAVVTINVNESGLKIGDRITIDHFGQKWCDRSFTKLVPTWYQREK